MVQNDMNYHDLIEKVYSVSEHRRWSSLYSSRSFWGYEL